MYLNFLLCLSHHLSPRAPIPRSEHAPRSITPQKPAKIDPIVSYATFSTNTQDKNQPDFQFERFAIII